MVKVIKIVLIGYQNSKFDIFKLFVLLLEWYFKRIKCWIKKKTKDSSVTGDYITAGEIQNQNWQYFVESVLEISRLNEIGKTI